MTAAQYRAVAVRLSRAAEQLIRASLELLAIDSRWTPDVIAWNREADGYLALALDYYALADEAERYEREGVAA